MDEKESKALRGRRGEIGADGRQFVVAARLVGSPKARFELKCERGG